MADILELALRHVIEHGMLPQDGTAMLEVFAKGEGRDIGWQDVAPRLPKPIADRIDWAATGEVD